MKNPCPLAIFVGEVQYWKRALETALSKFERKMEFPGHGRQLYIFSDSKMSTHLKSHLQAWNLLLGNV